MAKWAPLDLLYRDEYIAIFPMKIWDFNLFSAFFEGVYSYSYRFQNANFLLSQNILLLVIFQVPKINQKPGFSWIFGKYAQNLKNPTDLRLLVTNPSLVVHICAVSLLILGEHSKSILWSRKKRNDIRPLKSDKTDSLIEFLAQ